jgi:transcriptional regulator with XRE-family HTH domain
MFVRSGEQLIAARAALDIQQLTLSVHSGINQATISMWERDLVTPSERVTSKVNETLAKLKMIQKRYRGVPLNMNDIRFIRQELRKLDSSGKEIEQT